MSRDTVKQYRKELGLALKHKNLEKVKEALTNLNTNYGSSIIDITNEDPEMIIIMIHKLRYTSAYIPKILKEESADWLSNKGYNLNIMRTHL